MKYLKLMLIIFTTTVFTGGAARAADYSNEIDVAIAGLVSGDFGAYYERNLNGYFGVGGGGGYSVRRELFADVDEDLLENINWSFGHVRAFGKLYPLGGFRRLYLQVEMNGTFDSFEDKDTGATASESFIWPAGLIGWRWIIAERATINLAGGSGYATEKDVRLGDTTITFGALRPRVDLNVGFLF